MLRPVFIRKEKFLMKVQPEHIVCLVTEKNYTKIFLPDTSFYLVRSSLASILKILPEDVFVRIHRAYAVSVLYIDTIGKDVLVIAEKPFPIGRQYYRSLIKALDVIEWDKDSRDVNVEQDEDSSVEDMLGNATSLKKANKSQGGDHLSSPKRWTSIWLFQLIGYALKFILP
jgi:LytTr DNA-binding domain